MDRLWSLAVIALLGACSEGTAPVNAPTEVEPPQLAVTMLQFWQLEGGSSWTCGVTLDYRAYCWGWNALGVLGDGTLGDGATSNRLRPVAVVTSLRFRQVSAGNSHTCGVTTNYRAYCWGSNYYGELGTGATSTPRATPVAVAGGRQFRQVAAGWTYTCGITYPDDRAYCWGNNGEGQLGDGTRTTRLAPVAVAGSHYFKQVATAYLHSCAITTTTNQAYCWGNNRYGQLGDSTEIARRLKPSRVAAGARRFRQLETSYYHTCAVSTEYRAYCWGRGLEGELGNGKAYLSFWPRAVSGGLYFGRVTTGYAHTCGETTAGRAYCWGHRFLGDGKEGGSLVPVAVSGGLIFRQLSAGGYHTCGKTETGVGYCWGSNSSGQLGDGTTTSRLAPTRVAGTL